MRGLFITGTSTEVGKTFVTALIARRLVASGVRVGVYKPVASGCRLENGELVAEDAVQLWEAAGRPLSLEQVCPQRFEAAVAPNVAARGEGRTVDAELMRTGIDAWRNECDVLLVEGAGGLLSPLSENDFNADLAIDLGLPVVIVAANRLGVINDTLQTAITASVYDDGLEVAGVVLNNVEPNDDDASRGSNREELARLLIPPLLEELEYDATQSNVDWLSVIEG